MTRFCAACKVPLHECMGCVLARDICMALDGAIEWTQVREICAACAILFSDPEKLTAALAQGKDPKA